MAIFIVTLVFVLPVITDYFSGLRHLAIWGAFVFFLTLIIFALVLPVMIDYFAGLRHAGK